MKPLIIIGLFVGLLNILCLNKVSAISTPQVNGLTISPAIEQLNLLKGQTDASFVAQVTNNTKLPMLIEISTTDFTSLNQNGGISFISSNSSNNQHGLASWIKPGNQLLTLPASATQSVPIDIPNINSLAPGGHYGAIIYKVEPSGSSQLGNQINTNEEVSTLVFLTTYSGGTQVVRLENPPIGSLIDKIPNNINAVFTNSGNTQTAPKGFVSVTSPTGKEISRGIVNVDSGLILPQTSRLYNIELTSGHKVLYPGFYHIHIAYQAGGQNGYANYDKRFLVISKEFVAVVLVAIIGFMTFMLKMFLPFVKKKFKRIA